MEVSKIMSIINKRINDHKEEVTLCDDQIFKLQMVMKTQKLDLKLLQELAILKDRILFSKACLLLLNDIKKEIKETQ